jgi:hypothetical protein
VVRPSARHPAIASSLNHTVKLPRWRRLASYAAQFVIRRACLGMGWRLTALALNGTVGRAEDKGTPSYSRVSQTGRVPGPCNNVHWAAAWQTVQGIWDLLNRQNFNVVTAWQAAQASPAAVDQPKLSPL